MKRTSTAGEAREWLDRHGRRDFGADWARFAALCVNEYGWPFGIMHVGHFDKLEPPYLDETTADELTVAYVYLAACFFCMDHLYDNESSNDFEILAQSMLLQRAIFHIVGELQRLGLDVEIGRAEVGRLLDEFTRAMILEREIKVSTVLHSIEIERQHAIGRSWLVVFMYRLVQHIKGRPLLPEAQTLLEDGIYLLQLGDDWGDWREDYRAGNWSTFLRRCFSDMGQLPKDENELERFVYLSGAYENQGRLISSGLMKVATDLAKIYGEQGRGLVSVIDICQQRAEAVITNFERVKAGLSPIPVPGVVQ